MFPVHLSRDDGLLLVSSGHAACDGRRTFSAPDVKLLNKLVRVLKYLPAAYKASPFEFGLPIALKYHVVCKSKIEYQAVLMPVLRNMAHAKLAALSDRSACNIASGKRYAPGARLLKSGNCRNKLRLAVAVNTGDTNDLACMNIE